MRSHKALFAVAAFALGSCSPPKYQLDAEEKFRRDQAAVAPYIGHEYFIRSGTVLMVCAEPTLVTTCRPIRGMVTIDGFEGRQYADSWIHVSFRNGDSGYAQFKAGDLASTFFDHAPSSPVLLAGIYPSFLDHLKPAEAIKRRRLSGISLGMQKALVLSSAWGDPEAKSTLITNRRYSEKWSYPDGNVIYFEDNLVVGIRN